MDSKVLAQMLLEQPDTVKMLLENNTLEARDIRLAIGEIKQTEFRTHGRMPDLFVLPKEEEEKSDGYQIEMDLETEGRLEPPLPGVILNNIKITDTSPDPKAGFTAQVKATIDEDMNVTQKVVSVSPAEDAPFHVLTEVDDHLEMVADNFKFWCNRHYTILGGSWLKVLKLIAAYKKYYMAQLEIASIMGTYTDKVKENLGDKLAFLGQCHFIAYGNRKLEIKRNAETE